MNLQTEIIISIYDLIENLRQRIVGLEMAVERQEKALASLSKSIIEIEERLGMDDKE